MANFICVSPVCYRFFSKIIMFKNHKFLEKETLKYCLLSTILAQINLSSKLAVVYKPVRFQSQWNIEK